MILLITRYGGTNELADFWFVKDCERTVLNGQIIKYVVTQSYCYSFILQMPADSDSPVAELSALSTV
jgi:hypothetical protein